MRPNGCGERPMRPTNGGWRAQGVAIDAHDRLPLPLPRLCAARDRDAAGRCASRRRTVPVPAADALTTTAHALAVARWGVEPCGGQVAVTWAHMGAGINARSQWMSVDIHDPSTYSQCSITYNLDVDWDWPKLCTVIEHELGHLAGHEHVDDPHNVMSPYYVFPTPGVRRRASRAPSRRPAPVAVAQIAGSDDAGRSRRPSARSSSARWSSARPSRRRRRRGRRRKATAKSAKARAARAKTKAARSRSRAHGAAAANR